MTQNKKHDTHNLVTYTDSYAARQQQIRLDAMFSREIQAEEQICLAEHIKQIEKQKTPWVPTWPKERSDYPWPSSFK